MSEASRTGDTGDTGDTGGLTWSDVTTEHIAAETERVASTAASLRNDAVLAPSLCEGWSRGHVLSHLARNADALARVASVAVTGEPDTMYDSVADRDAEIDAGARRPASAQASDIVDSADRLAVVLGALRPEHADVTVERVPGGPTIPVARIWFMRLRELVFHHVDLDAGFGFDRVSPEIVSMFLGDAVARLQSDDDAPSLRLVATEGGTYVIGDGVTTASGSRAALLLWLARGRTDQVSFDGPEPTLPHGG